MCLSVNGIIWCRWRSASAVREIYNFHDLLVLCFASEIGAAFPPLAAGGGGGAVVPFLVSPHVSGNITALRFAFLLVSLHLSSTRVVASLGVPPRVPASVS